MMMMLIIMMLFVRRGSCEAYIDKCKIAMMSVERDAIGLYLAVWALSMES